MIRNLKKNLKRLRKIKLNEYNPDYPKTAKEALKLLSGMYEDTRTR